MRYLFTLLMIFSVQSFSRQSVPIVNDEAWIKLTCFGIVTPVGIFPAIEREIMKAHIRLNTRAPYPSFEDVRDNNSAFFKNYTRLCTERRRARVELNGLPPEQWLDWGTDWAYTRYEIGEVYINSSNVGLCRNVGGPCVTSAQCCGSQQMLSTCNVTVNTCESTVIIDRNPATFRVK